MGEEKWVTIKGRHVLIGEDGEIKDKKIREEMGGDFNAKLNQQYEAAERAARKAANAPSKKDMDKIADVAIDMIKKDFGEIEIDFDDESSRGGLDLWFRSTKEYPDEDTPHKFGWDLDPILEKLRTKYPKYTFNLMDPDDEEGYEFIRIELKGE